MLGTRIITGLILGCAITLTLLFLPSLAVAALFGLLWLAGGWEWAALARLSGGARVAYVAVLFACMLLALLVITPAAAGLAAIVAALGWVAALIAIVTYPRPFSTPAVAVSGFLALLPSWGILCYLHATQPQGRELALTVLIIVWAADVGAYALGRMIGRVKLAPKVSPGKSWEGVIGGVLLASAAAWVAALVLELPVGAMIGLGIATALVSVVGDLTVSMFKRNVGAKDSGTLLPGHGGVMDRIDSLTAAIPIFALGLKFAGLMV